MRVKVLKETYMQNIIFKHATVQIFILGESKEVVVGGWHQNWGQHKCSTDPCIVCFNLLFDSLFTYVVSEYSHPYLLSYLYTCVLAYLTHFYFSGSAALFSLTDSSLRQKLFIHFTFTQNVTFVTYPFPT